MVSLASMLLLNLTYVVLRNFPFSAPEITTADGKYRFAETLRLRFGLNVSCSMIFTFLAFLISAPEVTTTEGKVRHRCYKDSV